MSKSYIFVLQTEDGELSAGRQSDVDALIRESEDANVDLDFTTIGKISEPPQGLTLDFSANLIQWYKPDEVTPDLINYAVMAIIKFLTNN